jgi:hypothetical protein
MMKWIGAASLTLLGTTLLGTTFLGTMSAQAFTCADVRALSAEQRAYYIRVLNITPAQQETIRQTCSGPHTRQASASGESSGRHSGNGVRDVRYDQ